MSVKAHFNLHHNQIRDYDESKMGTNGQDKRQETSQGV
jgi:hypothetical protein